MTIPARCPKCKACGLTALGRTPSGVFPWRCAACRSIGYDERVVGDPIPSDAPRARRGKKGTAGKRFVRRPARAVDPEDVP